MRPAGTIQGEQERVFLRVSGAFDSERDIESVNIVAGDRTARLAFPERVTNGAQLRAVLELFADQARAG